MDEKHYKKVLKALPTWRPNFQRRFSVSSIVAILDDGKGNRSGVGFMVAYNIFKRLEKEGKLPEGAAWHDY